MSTAADSALGDLGARYALKTFVECCLILEEGVAAAKDIDAGLAAAAGMDPPPFAGADRDGLDTVLARLERAADEWGEDFTPPAILRRLVAQGRLGAQAGQGFFSYPRPDAGYEDKPVKLESRGEVAIAWLDRPPANSLSPEMIGAIREVWDVIAGTEVRVLVFASANPMLFCAGADIKAFARMDTATSRTLLDDAHGLFRALETAPIITIAAVGGIALGGGCELAMACDFRIAAEAATFGQPEIGLGIIPGFGGTQRLPRLIGEARALELNLIGEPISGIEAYEIGLAHRAVPGHELLDTALSWARRLAGQAPLAVARIKRVSAAPDIEDGIVAEKAAFAELFASADAKEGFAAFVSKRAPRWTGE